MEKTQRSWPMGNPDHFRKNWLKIFEVAHFAWIVTRVRRLQISWQFVKHLQSQEKRSDGRFMLCFPIDLDHASPHSSGELPGSSLQSSSSVWSRIRGRRAMFSHLNVLNWNISEFSLDKHSIIWRSRSFGGCFWSRDFLRPWDWLRSCTSHVSLTAADTPSQAFHLARNCYFAREIEHHELKPQKDPTASTKGILSHGYYCHRLKIHSIAWWLSHKRIEKTWKTLKV
jgi:hypothetical protein